MSDYGDTSLDVVIVIMPKSAQSPAEQTGKHIAISCKNSLRLPSPAGKPKTRSIVI